MKTTLYSVTILIFLISINTVSAQFNNNGYGGNGYGRNNGMNQMGAMSQRSQPEAPKETPPEEMVAKFMEEMKPEVGLDELQTIAITNILVESIKTQGRILKLTLTQEEQSTEFKTLAENTDRKVMNFLSKEQKDKYTAFKEDRQNSKKSKSKDKKKEKKSESKDK